MAILYSRVVTGFTSQWSLIIQSYIKLVMNQFLSQLQIWQCLRVFHSKINIQPHTNHLSYITSILILLPIELTWHYYLWFVSETHWCKNMMGDKIRFDASLGCLQGSIWYTLANFCQHLQCFNIVTWVWCAIVENMLDTW